MCPEPESDLLSAPNARNNQSGTPVPACGTENDDRSNVYLDRGTATHLHITRRARTAPDPVRRTREEGGVSLRCPRAEKRRFFFDSV
ncbi:MAG: hypothetical protein Kow0059_19290 [Candidatus Sumerlaeia bacterium]